MICPLRTLRYWRVELGYSPGAKIYRFAAGERAPRRLSLKCEPKFRRWRNAGLEAAVRGDKKCTPQFEGCIFYGSGTRIRTQTYRVRVCCATFTQFRYIHFSCLYILAQKYWFVKWFLEFFEKVRKFIVFPFKIVLCFCDSCRRRGLSYHR